MKKYIVTVERNTIIGGRKKPDVYHAELSVMAKTPRGARAACKGHKIVDIREHMPKR